MLDFGRELPNPINSCFNISYGGTMDIFGLYSRHGLNGFEQIAIIGVLVVAFISLLYAWWLRGGVMKKDDGTQR